MIARQFLETPRDLHIHWVWLPLYHVLLAAGIAAGATLDHVRYANALLSAGTPLLLWWGLARMGQRRVSALAAALAACAPISISMGTTAQPESLFALLLLSLALLLARERYAGAALVGAALVLLRYEAWAAAAGVAALLVWRRARGVPPSLARPSRAQLACVLAPALSVAGWTLLRRLDGGAWFDFLRHNQSFAEAARSHSALSWPELERGLDAAPVAAWLLGLACLLAGLPRSWRATGGWFVILPLAVAAFLVLGWLTRSHLGLTRHWVSLVPFAATAIALGVEQLADWSGRVLKHARAPAFVSLAALALGLELRALELPLRDWRQHTAAALLDRRDAARFLRSVPPDVLILCDDAAAEVLSELPAARFRRNYLGADAAGQIRRWARESELVVLSAAERLLPALERGELVYGDPASTGLVGLRVPRAR